MEKEMKEHHITPMKKSLVFKKYQQVQGSRNSLFGSVSSSNSAAEMRMHAKSNRQKDTDSVFPTTLPKVRLQNLAEKEQNNEMDPLAVDVSDITTKIYKAYDEEGCLLPLEFCNNKCCVSYVEEPKFPPRDSQYLSAIDQHKEKLAALKKCKGKNLPSNITWYDSVVFKDLCEKCSVPATGKYYKQYLEGTLPEGYNAKDHYASKLDPTTRHILQCNYDDTEELKESFF